MEICSDLKEDGGRLGPLLWVRRPNGSWWPGLVLSPDQFVERRKGTPVKLLGREDGSMDWYDLEKSKRIKAFRCGEYDDCIEKAKASALYSNKDDRIGKYARRGDAILHALEIERAYCENGSPKATKEQKHLVIKINKKRKETELSQSVISFENNARTSRLNVSKKNRWRTHSDFEEDVASGSTKRMKGLQDLGIRSKREANVVQYNCRDGTTPDGSSIQSIPSSRLIRLRQVNNSKDLCVPLKRNVLSGQLNENLRRKNRRRPLTKLLECTSRLVLPSSCKKLCCFSKPSVQNRSVALNSPESRKTELSDVIDDNSDCSDKSCEEDTDAVEETPFDFQSNEYSAVDDGDDSFYGRLVDVPIVVEKNVAIDYSQLISSCISNSHASILEKNTKQCSLPVKTLDKKETCEKLMEGTSNWNSKGKRNSKSSGIRFIKKPTRFFPNGKYFRGDSLLSGVNDDILNHGETWRCRIAPRDPRNVIANQISEVSNLKSNSKEHGFGKNINLPNPMLTLQNQSEFSVDHQDINISDRRTYLNSSLYEVRINVESKYKKCSSDHAPVISLMSKFSNTAIVGHPVSIEVMDDCSTISLKAQMTLSKKRSCLKAKKSPLTKKKSSKMKKSMQRKIRKLSSITEHDKEIDADMEPLMERSNKRSVIACVPLNLVFSRINEALGCCSLRPSCYTKPPLSSLSSPE